MKINEFIKGIHKVDKSLNVYQYPNSLWVTYNSRTFIKIPFDAKTIFDCRINDEIEDLTDGIKIDVSNKINKFLATPLDERFPEKKYRLRWFDDRGGKVNYIHNAELSGIWELLVGKDQATIFTESQLEKLKREDPRLAPAVDAMKEPAGENE